MSFTEKIIITVPMNGREVKEGSAKEVDRIGTNKKEMGKNMAGKRKKNKRKATKKKLKKRKKNSLLNKEI